MTSIQKMKNYYIYILECFDKSFYVGVCNDLERRLWEHKEGMDKKSYTHKRRPLKLVYFEVTTDINSAIAREKQLKGWRREKKIALIEGSVGKLSRLSKSRNTGTLRQ